MYWCYLLFAWCREWALNLLKNTLWSGKVSIAQIFNYKTTKNQLYVIVCEFERNFIHRNKLANLHDHTAKAKVVLKIKAHELTEIDLHQKLYL